GAAVVVGGGGRMPSHRERGGEIAVDQLMSGGGGRLGEVEREVLDTRTRYASGLTAGQIGRTGAGNTRLKFDLDLLLGCAGGGHRRGDAFRGCEVVVVL